mmetsp:Transcript_33968/g.44830  ORF Transcript_33968/g.44830 Transcript_33968/m.44830 type:complete len:222 (+) Transcript_33968:1316-1981(+)
MKFAVTRSPTSYTFVGRVCCDELLYTGILKFGFLTESKVGFFIEPANFSIFSEKLYKSPFFFSTGVSLPFCFTKKIFLIPCPELAKPSAVTSSSSTSSAFEVDAFLTSTVSSSGFTSSSTAGISSLSSSEVGAPSLDSGSTGVSSEFFSPSVVASSSLAAAAGASSPASEPIVASVASASAFSAPFSLAIVSFSFLSAISPPTTNNDLWVTFGWQSQQKQR